MKKKRYVITDASSKLGLNPEFVVQCIQARWIEPASPELNLLDEEDLARMRLIHELMEDFGANAESIPIILHLLDQLYFIQERLERAAPERRRLNLLP